MADQHEVLAAWEQYADELADQPNVTSVSMGYRTRAGKRTRTPALIVTVERKVAPELLPPSALLPREVRLDTGEVVEVDVVEDPAQYTMEVDSATYRPVPGGCEIGRWGSTAVGTLGGWFSQPRPDGSGWRTVWLTNAHVASGNSSSIPADPRITQPGGGGVIGRTVDLVGYPTPGPAAGALVDGVCDAAIGALEGDVLADLQVLEIAPAPFEIGEATVGLAVQKRGRTTELTQGTVDGTTGMPPWITVNMASPNSAGQVRFGSPGNPRVYRVRSNGTGLGNAFTGPGDSGSLYFGVDAGRVASTVPALGLHFAGTFRWVESQPNPNTLTVTSVGFDLAGVMEVFGLDTVCNGVVRSLLDAILTGRRRDQVAVGQAASVARSERMMRSFRDHVLARSSVGKRIAAAVAEATPHAARAITQDPIAYGLTVDLLRPWVEASTSLDVLRRELDPETVRTARELAERLVQLSPQLKEPGRPMLELLEKHQGEPVRKLIGRMTPVRLPTLTPKR